MKFNENNFDIKTRVKFPFMSHFCKIIRKWKGPGPIEHIRIKELNFPMPLVVG